MVDHLWLVVTYSNSDLPIQIVILDSCVEVYQMVIFMGNLQYFTHLNCWAIEGDVFPYYT